jgi:RNA polymerase sigma-70 factor (ECF subfamily)
MATDQSLQELLARLRAGDQGAATDIFRRFARRLAGLARARLDGALRQKVDAEDVLQSVFKSFFLRQSERPYDLENWDGLWGLLAQITVRKCAHKAEHFHAARRDVGREAPPANSSEVGWEALAREPTPLEAVLLTDTVERLMRNLAERDRTILALSLQGFTSAEISEQAGCTERTVYRVLAVIREQLESMRDSEASGD